MPIPARTFAALAAAPVLIIGQQRALSAQDSATPPPAYSVAGAFDPARGLVIFGGYLRGSYAGDTWEHRDGRWNRIDGTSPSPRNGPVMVYDVARKQIVLFGGDTRATGPLGDTWVREGTAWRQADTAGPPPRSVFAMAYDAARQRVVLFGGSGASGLLGDTWEWDGSHWTRRATDGPPARTLHALAYDPVRHRVVLYGGKTALTPDAPSLGDTWEWDGTTWRQIAVAAPGGRDHHAMTYDPTRSAILLYGGAGPDGEHGRESWSYDGSMWRRLPFEGPRRLFPVLTLDSNSGTPLLFGGFDNQPTSDLFMLTAGRWIAVPVP